jgi:hypothetical protein
MKKIYVRYFILSIINSFLFLIIPLYFFWYWIFIFLAGAGLIATIIIDIMDKTNNWKIVLQILGFVVFSYILGLLLIRIFNIDFGFPN